MKKLIRRKIESFLRVDEKELIENKIELNNLYSKKIIEELIEIRNSYYEDPNEFADLISVVFDFAKQHGFEKKQIVDLIEKKEVEKGCYSNIALTNLNPNNKSNFIYLQTETELNALIESLS